MSLAQALAIAAAASVTAMTVNPTLPAAFDRTHAQAERLAARLELRAHQIAGGFRSTPDGHCLERGVILR